MIKGRAHLKQKKKHLSTIYCYSHNVLYITDTYQLTLISDLVCTHSLYDPLYRAKDKKVEHINTAEWSKQQREKWKKTGEERKGRKKKGKTSKEIEDMMEQARGRSNQTPPSYTHIYTHIQAACHSYVIEEGKPQLEINYSVPFTEGIWGFFTLFSFSGQTPLPWRHLTLWAQCYQKTCPLFSGWLWGKRSPRLFKLGVNGMKRK